MADWLKNALFYEIYPQSFMDANDDGIGDLEGIIRKLDYIKDLGFNAIWVNPCFESPFGDAGYDVSDYYRIAPRYGTNEDAERLFAQVHKRGMHILFDLVPGHTSDQHPWFLESKKPEHNLYSDRYIWTDNVWISPEGFDCLRGISDRPGACVTNFFSFQPALNYGFYEIREPWQQSTDAPGPRETISEMLRIMRFWLSKGLDGFRVDMAGSLVKNDPEGLGTIALWKNVIGIINHEFPEAAFVSEWGEPDKSLMGGFQMDFLLHFGPSHYMDLFRCEHPYFAKSGQGDASLFVSRYKENYEKTCGKGLICIPSGNHDMERLAHSLDEAERKIAFSFLLSMPGAPFVYYGDEIGMRYVENLTSLEGGYNRTGSRTPMQWDNSCQNAGFSKADPEKLYLPQDPASDHPDTVSEKKRAGSLLNEIKELIQLRNIHPALGNTSDISFLYDGKDGMPLAYIRSCPEEKILVVLNPADREAALTFSDAPKECIFRIGESMKNTSEHLYLIPPCSAGYYSLS